MNPKIKQPGDSNLAIHAAKHFFGLAGTFFGSIPVDGATLDAFLNQSENIGKLIAASVNLAFSVELYLKELAIKTKGRAIGGHQLIHLFKDLPPDVQEWINQRYRHRFAHRPKAKFITIDFIIATLNPLPPEVKNRVPILSGADEGDVCKVLEVENDAFQKWRYVYEQAPAAGWVRVTVHYCHLGVLVNSIQDQFKPLHERP